MMRGSLLGSRPFVVLVLVALVLASTPHAASAQRGGRGNFQSYFGSPDDFYTPPDFKGNPAYDGRFTFARIKYRGYGHWSGSEGPGWSHDYPNADEHLVKILKEVTTLHPYLPKKGMAGGVIVALDDPELFKYPIAYFSEPGGWAPNEKEVLGMRNYLLKGGFVLFDDFGGQQDWNNLLLHMRRALPDIRPVQLTGKEPIFDSFFKIDVKAVERQCLSNRRACYRGVPQWWGWYENGDPKRRLIAVGALNADIGEFWQWSGTGFAAVDQSNEVFKIGVNFLIYGLTH
jgi:hypothetical protein